MNDRDSIRQIEEFLQNELENKTGGVYFSEKDRLSNEQNGRVFKDFASLDALLKDVADLVGTLSGINDDLRELRERLQKIEERLGVDRIDDDVGARRDDGVIGDSIIKDRGLGKADIGPLENLGIEKKRDEIEQTAQSKEGVQLRDRVNWLVVQVAQLFSHVGELFRRDQQRWRVATPSAQQLSSNAIKRMVDDAVNARFQEMLHGDVKNAREALGRVLKQQDVLRSMYGEMNNRVMNIDARIAFLQRQLDVHTNSAPQLVRAIVNSSLIPVARDIARLRADISNINLTARRALDDARVALNKSIQSDFQSQWAMRTAGAALREAMGAHRRINEIRPFN